MAFPSSANAHRLVVAGRYTGWKPVLMADAAALTRGAQDKGGAIRKSDKGRMKGMATAARLIAALPLSCARREAAGKRLRHRLEACAPSLTDD